MNSAEKQAAMIKRLTVANLQEITSKTREQEAFRKLKTLLDDSRVAYMVDKALLQMKAEAEKGHSGANI